MYCIVEQSQRDEVFHAIWLTIFQVGRNKPEGTVKKIIIKEDIATITLNNQQYYIYLNYCSWCCTYSSVTNTNEE